jgi:TonB family protein
LSDQEYEARVVMKSNESLLLTLMLFVGFAPGSALPQSVTPIVAGRVIGLPGGNVPSFEILLVRDGAPCAVLKTHTLADGSFRFSSVRAGSYFLAVEGLSDGYGINKMTDGRVDLLFDSMKIAASAPTQVLIEIARVEEIRRKPVVGSLGGSQSCLIHQVKPLYSPQVKAAHIVGNVILSIDIDRDGYVKDVRVVQGHPLLIQSAINAVRQWRYAPFVFHGMRTPIKITVVLPFGPK